MSDRIDFGGKPWTAIPRELLRDRRLSPRAKGGLVSLLSHEDGFVRSCVALLIGENHCGRDQARAILRELAAAGYAELRQERGEGGQFRTAYTIRPTVGPATSGVGTSGSPGTESPPTVPPATVSPSTEVEALDVEALDVEPDLEDRDLSVEMTSKKRRRSTPRSTEVVKSDPDFAEFWKVYPRSSGKDAAARAWEIRMIGTKAKPWADAADIIAGARRYAADPNRDDAYTKHASRWLNDGCWEDGPLPDRGPARRGPVDIDAILARTREEGTG